MKETVLSTSVHEKAQQICLDNNLSFVSYHMPGSTENKTLIQFSSPAKHKKLPDLNSFSGFIFAPFMHSERYPILQILPDIIIDSGSCESSVLEKLASVKVNYTENPPSKLTITSKNEYQANVDQIKKMIEFGTIHKMVLSRVHLEPRPSQFEITSWYHLLCDIYPDAFSYLICVPGCGCWIGASPEPLVELSKGMVKTVSLAGTQPYNQADVSVRWDRKELEEQQIVTRYIEDVIKRFAIPEFYKKGPETQQAGNLFHLKTEFSFELSKLKKGITSFIEELHPTPSVCGIPKEEAGLFLQQIEKHDREYYTGFLGPVNMNQSTNLFVNLRCMKVLPDSLALFLGAGITAGSNSENEWEETNSKKMTLLSVIQKSKNL